MNGTPTVKAIDLIAYMFINNRGFTLKELTQRYDCSKQSILRYLANIDGTCFGQIRELDNRGEKESLYILEVNKELIKMFEKSKNNILKKDKELKHLAQKSNENKKIIDKRPSKIAEDQISTKKKSNIAKTKSAKGKKEEKWQKRQKTKPTKKDKK